MKFLIVIFKFDWSWLGQNVNKIDIIYNLETKFVWLDFLTQTPVGGWFGK